MIERQRWFGIPLARRRNRRWVVALYWLIVALAFAVLAWYSSWSEQPLSRQNPMWFYSAALIVTGILGGRERNGLVKLFPKRRQQEAEDYAFMTAEDISAKKAQLKASAWDEREANAFLQYQSNAYSFLTRMALPTLFLLFFLDIPTVAAYAFLRKPILWFLLIVLWSLPQTLILWTEPDMEKQP